MAKMTENELAYTANLPGAERGDPTYFENEVIDHLIGIVLELGAQFWVMRDRLAFLEEKVCEAGDISLEDLEQGRPSAELQTRLQNERREMIRQIYGRLYARSGGEAVDPVSAPMS